MTILSIFYFFINEAYYNFTRKKIHNLFLRRPLGYKDYCLHRVLYLKLYVYNANHKNPYKL